MNNSADNYVAFNPVIENIIEISMIYAKLRLLDDTVERIDFNAVKHMITDWGNEFEERFGDIDWSKSDDDYVSVIHDFAIWKILKMIGYSEDKILPLMEMEWTMSF